jgi:hypothetical protein
MHAMVVPLGITNSLSVTLASVNGIISWVGRTQAAETRMPSYISWVFAPSTMAEEQPENVYPFPFGPQDESHGGVE